MCADGMNSGSGKMDPIKQSIAETKRRCGHKLMAQLCAIVCSRARNTARTKRTFVICPTSPQQRAVPNAYSIWSCVGASAICIVLRVREVWWNECRVYYIVVYAAAELIIGMKGLRQSGSGSRLVPRCVVLFIRGSCRGARNRKQSIFNWLASCASWHRVLMKTKRSMHISSLNQVDLRFAQI